MSTSKSYRILKIYTCLEEGKEVNPDNAAQDFKVDKRTIQRDIADIQAFLADMAAQTGQRKSVMYDRERRGYILKGD